ncbi:hypothetical protein ACOME3_001673 [Neoechinorhynchus agilis]
MDEIKEEYWESDKCDQYDSQIQNVFLNVLDYFLQYALLGFKNSFLRYFTPRIIRSFSRGLSNLDNVGTGKRDFLFLSFSTPRIQKFTFTFRAIRTFSQGLSLFTRR